MVAIVNWSILAYNLFSLSTFISLYCLDDSKMLADAKSESSIFSELEFKEIGIMVDWPLLDNLSKGENGFLMEGQCGGEVSLYFRSIVGKCF